MGDRCSILNHGDCHFGLASSSGRTALQACCICGGGGSSSRPSPTSASTKAPTQGSGFTHQHKIDGPYYIQDCVCKAGYYDEEVALSKVHCVRPPSRWFGNNKAKCRLQEMQFGMTRLLDLDVRLTINFTPHVVHVDKQR